MEHVNPGVEPVLHTELNPLLTRSFSINELNRLWLDRVKYLKVSSDSKGLINYLQSCLLSN